MKLFEDKETNIIIKKLFLLLGVILLIFASINAIWYFGYRHRYDTVAKKLEKTYMLDIEEDEALRYTKEVGNYTISMKMPAYLGEGGYISIARTSGYEVTLDDEGNIISGDEMDISLYIWPEYFSDYKIGLDFLDEANSVWEQVELTSEMELTDTENMDNEYIEYIEKLISENQEEITNLIRIADENLGIHITAA